MAFSPTNTWGKLELATQKGLFYFVYNMLLQELKKKENKIRPKWLYCIKCTPGGQWINLISEGIFGSVIVHWVLFNFY